MSSRKAWTLSFTVLIGLVGACEGSKGRPQSQPDSKTLPDAAAGSGGVGGSSSGGSGGSIAPSDANADAVSLEALDCATLPQRVCEKLSRCNGFKFRQNYGDAATCERRISAVCGALATSGPVFNVGGCSAALALAHCQGWVSGNVPSVCVTPLGAAEAGSTCGANQQCRGGYCKLKEECGVCVAVAGEGGSCESSLECEAGLVCRGGSCVAPALAGASCGDSQPCAEPLGCVEGVCAVLGGDQSACSLGRLCDSTRGFGCSGGVCVAQATAMIGESCGISTACIGGSKCLAGSDGGRTCQSAGELADPCSDARPCAPPLHCMGGSCTVLDPGQCAR